MGDNLCHRAHLFSVTKEHFTIFTTHVQQLEKTYCKVRKRNQINAASRTRDSENWDMHVVPPTEGTDWHDSLDLPVFGL